MTFSAHQAKECASVARHAKGSIIWRRFDQNVLGRHQVRTQPGVLPLAKLQQAHRRNQQDLERLLVPRGRGEVCVCLRFGGLTIHWGVELQLFRQCLPARGIWRLKSS